jgi:chromosome segregation ATPase
LQVEEVTSSARLALQHSQIEVRQRLHIGLEAVQEAERQKAALQDSSDNLARSYHTLRDDFASLEHKLSALQRSKDAADEEIKLQQRELQQVRDEARHSISKSFEDVGQMEKDLRAHYAVKFSNAEAEIEGLRARHAKLSEASRQALEDMQMVIMRNEHEIQSLQQAQEAIQNDRSAVVEAHALTSSRLKDAESQIITLKTHIDASNAEMQSLKGSLAASEADRKALKLTLDQHKDSCMQVTAPLRAVFSSTQSNPLSSGYRGKLFGRIQVGADAFSSCRSARAAAVAGGAHCSFRKGGSAGRQRGPPHG